MRTLLRSLSVFVFFISAFSVNAQTHTTADGRTIDRCGSVEHLQAQMQADPTLAARMQAIEQFTQNYVAAHPNGNNSRSVITVPVVFHVIYSNSTENISDAFCQAQVSQMNLDYARQNTDASNTPAPFAAVAANTGIQFCLAVRDPNGAATTGIIHKSTTVTSWSTDDAVKYSAQGGDDAWPADSYLNIWSCNLGGGLLGYSQFPGGPAATDGCVILYNTIGSMLYPTTATPYNLGRTVTHEVGHWLNMIHIWGDDGGACTGSDQVADTPNQGSENYGCPTYPLTDNCTTTNPGVMFMNYMDYTDDACMNIFTQGQATRMNANFTTGGARVSILNSQGCVPIGPVCSAATGMATTGVTATSATFTWSAVTGAASYVLQYRVVGTSTWTTVTVTGTTKTVTGLTPNSSYEWQVQTVCSNGGSSSFTGSTNFTTAGPPVANFSANVTSSCTGIINFTDLTTGVPSSWLWSFGDGTTSNAQNPQHQYVTNGTFTVALTATNSFGSNTATKTNYITINKPAAPSVTAGSHCGPGPVTLSSPATDTIKWYANATDVTPVSTSNPFVTPSLTNTTTYYAEEITAGSNATVGPATYTTLGAGSIFSNATSQYLIFNCLSACTLKSVVVDATTAGSRTIELRNSAGTVLQSATVNIAAGVSTVTLNFSLPVGDSLQMGINGTANLFRNNAVTGGYPFTLPGVVSITTSSAGLGYYYFFYNWVIQQTSCVSLRAPVTATITAGLTANAAATNVNCYGGSTGSASLTVTGGTPAYTYSWSNGQTTSSLNNVAQGTYTVTVSDASSCSGTQTVSISQPTQLAVAANATNASCSLSNGSVVSNTSGGTPGYTFHWSNGASTSSVTGLSSGTYTLTVNDSHNCSVTATSTIISAGALNIAPTTNNVSCFGANNGSITVVATGGTPTYTYVWNGGANGGTISNLAPGSYTVSATDASGCSATQSFTITQPAQLQLTAGSTNASCGFSNGTVEASATGGTPNYAYAWSNGATASSITGLSSGTYSVTVSDNRNCSATGSASIVNSGSMSLVASAVQVSCFGGSTGSVSLNVTGGAPAYTYAWSNGGTTPGISSLAAGNYVVTVTDAGGCTSTANISINQPSQLGVTSHTTPPLCSGASNGTIYVTGTGATPGYTYLWSDGSTSSTLTNLPSGSYAITITDANACTMATSVNLSPGATIAASFNTTNATCNGEANGSTSLTASGGTAAYSYLWSNGSTGSTITGLQAGTYNVTITDANSCTATSSAIVNQPAPIVISTSSTNTTQGHTTGSVSIHNITGAAAPFVFVWSTHDSTITVSNLGVGVYTVTLTDANGCSQTASAIVNVTTGIGTVNADIAFSIFPNPASTELNVTLDNLKDNAILSIKNALGQTVNQEEITQSSTSVMMDVSKLAAGIYLVELRSGNNWAVKQVIITR